MFRKLMVPIFRADSCASLSLLRMRKLELCKLTRTHMDDDPVLQDSVVGGDLHVGDVHHNTTNIDKSTNVELPSFDNVSEKVASAAKAVGKSSVVAFGGLSEFMKGTINKILLLAGLIVVVTGFLIYNGNIDVIELVNNL